MSSMKNGRGDLGRNVVRLDVRRVILWDRQAQASRGAGHANKALATRRHRTYTRPLITTHGNQRDPEPMTGAPS